MAHYPAKFALRYPPLQQVQQKNEFLLQPKISG